ncbi:MAG: insulinase family protein [Saprospiraceae bacterium]|nr:insulinase family protein [Saprospiraceae bacterium]
MKKLLIIILSGVFFMHCTPKMVTENKVQPVDFRAVAPAPKPAPAIAFGDYQSFTLENGMKVIVVENSKVPKLGVKLFLNRKPFKEGKKAGVGEFMGSMLSKGSATRTKQQIDEEIDFLGAQFSTSQNGFYVSGLSKYADKMLEIAADAVLKPAFPQSEFDKIKTQKMSELASLKDEPNAISGIVASVLNYGSEHPYGEVATEETCSKLMVEDCKELYNKYFNAYDSYLVFVGDIKGEDARMLAEKLFGKWANKGFSTDPLPKISFPDKTTANYVAKRGAVQSVIGVTYPVDLKPNSPDLIKVRIMNTILGGYFRSRLNQNLREDRGYTYGIRSSLNDDMEIGQFYTSASVRNEVTDTAIDQVLIELKKLRTVPVAAEELKVVKSVMSGNFGMALEDPNTIAEFALKTERYKLPKSFYRDYLKNMESVTSDDILKMAQKYLSPDKCNILVIGDKNTLSEKLKKYGKVNQYDIFGKPVAEEKPASSGLSLKDLLIKNMDAIGGQKNIDNVKTLESSYTAEMQGMKLEIWELKTEGKKSAMKVNMMGQTMQEQVCNGVKGYQSMQGQKKDLQEQELKEAIEESFIFPVQGMSSDKYSLGNTEKVEGTEYYTIQSKSGNKSSVYYFNTKTFLLEIEEKSISEGGESQTITREFKDYKNYDGVMLPGKIIMKGAMPFPLELTIADVKINKSFDESIFKF